MDLENNSMNSSNTNDIYKHGGNIEQEAKKLGVKTITYSQDWELSSSLGNIYLRFEKLHSVFPIPSLQGEHQLTNAATAAIAAKLIKKSEINDDVIGAGIRSTFWPGRLQKQLRSSRSTCNLFIAMAAKASSYRICLHKQS